MCGAVGLGDELPFGFFAEMYIFPLPNRQLGVCDKKKTFKWRFRNVEPHFYWGNDTTTTPPSSFTRFATMIMKTTHHAYVHAIQKAMPVMSKRSKDMTFLQQQWRK